MQHCSILCSVHHATLQHTVQCSPCNTAAYCAVFTMQHCSILCSVHHATLQYTVQCSPCNTAVYCSVFTMQHCSILFSVHYATNTIYTEQCSLWDTQMLEQSGFSPLFPYQYRSQLSSQRENSPPFVRCSQPCSPAAVPVSLEASCNLLRIGDAGRVIPRHLRDPVLLCDGSHAVPGT